MILVGIGSGLLGAVLSFRFKVMVLFPVAFIGLASIVLVALAFNMSVRTAGLAFIVCAIAAQIGYVAGLFTRFVIAASRTKAHVSQNHRQLPSNGQI